MGKRGAPADGQLAQELSSLGEEFAPQSAERPQGEVPVAYERGIEALVEQRRQIAEQGAYVLGGQVGETVDAGSCLDLAQQGDRA
ncbi:hypothetical protein [Streptomyces sp. NPDC001435]|uniref:hypothetical protein n=1 Tax=unclassified Streptomyces TaxID=2593676 RepID=UPI0036BE7494